jgi:predicted O-methyltransferase YrrM
MKPLTTYPYSPELLTSKDFFWNCKKSDEIAAYYEKLKQRQLVNPTDGDEKPLLAICQNEKKLCSFILSTVPTMHGWSKETKCCAMAALIVAMKPRLIVEIGVFAGRSLLPMAMAMKHTNNPGKVIGIDPYSREESVKGEYGLNSEWWGNLDHNPMHDLFLEFVKRFGLEAQVQLVKKPSDAVQPMEYDMIHVDGNHSEQALRDAERFGPKCSLGGIAVLDDLMWIGGGPLRAIDALEDMGFVEAFRITGDGECWNVMQRVRV